MDLLKHIYLKDRKMIRLMAVVIAFMTAMTVFQCTASGSYGSNGIHKSAEDAEVTLLDNMELYAGIFTTSVQGSVNPTATLALLSVIGAFENMELFFPEWEWGVKVGNTFESMPILRQMKSTPVANPFAAVLLVLVAITMIVVHCFKASKLVSNVTLDKIEMWGGVIAMVCMTLLPLFRFSVVSSASDGDDKVTYIKWTTLIATIIIAIIVLVIDVIIYLCVYGCIDALEFIAATLPIPGSNLIVELIRMIIHGLLVFLQILQVLVPILAPVILAVTIILSIVIAVVACIIFSKLSKVSTYGGYIYARPFIRKIFKKNEVTPLVHKKYPRRARKKFPDTQMAIPIFPLVKMDRNVKKQQIMWLIMDNNQPYLLLVKWFRKIRKISLYEYNKDHGYLFMKPEKKYIKLISQDGQVSFAISNEYKEQWQKISSITGVYVIEEKIEDNTEYEYKKGAGIHYNYSAWN